MSSDRLSGVKMQRHGAESEQAELATGPLLSKRRCEHSGVLVLNSSERGGEKKVDPFFVTGEPWRLRRVLIGQEAIWRLM